MDLRPHEFVFSNMPHWSPKTYVSYEIILCIIKLFTFVFHFNEGFAYNNLCTPFSKAWQHKSLSNLLDPPAVMGATNIYFIDFPSIPARYIKKNLKAHLLKKKKKSFPIKIGRSWMMISEFNLFSFKFKASHLCLFTFLKRVYLKR